MKESRYGNVGGSPFSQLHLSCLCCRPWDEYNSLINFIYGFGDLVCKTKLWVRTHSMWSISTYVEWMAPIVATGLCRCVSYGIVQEYNLLSCWIICTSPN